MDGEIRGGGSPSPSLRHQSIPPQLQPSAALQLFTWITPVQVGAYRWFTTVVCPNILSCTPLTRLTFKSSACTGPDCAGRFTLTHDTQVSAALCSIIHYVLLPSLHVDISACIKVQIYTRVYLWKPLYQQVLVFLSCGSTSWIPNVTKLKYPLQTWMIFHQNYFVATGDFSKQVTDWEDYVFRYCFCHV